MIVRRAERSDVTQVVEFTRNTWEWGDYVPREFEKWVVEGTAYVAELDGVVVAAARIVKVGDSAYLQGLRVRPEYRRRGVGRAVTEFLLGEAKRLGAKTATLLVAEWNKPSLSLVEKVGFKPILSIYGGVPLPRRPDRCLEGDEALRALEEALRHTDGHACLPEDPWICIEATPQLLLQRARPCVSESLYVGRFSFGGARVDTQGDVTALRPEGFAKLYGRYVLFRYDL
ncbi:MAG: GNAT family N-acetyltransferase [Thermoproteus sp.]